MKTYSKDYLQEIAFPLSGIGCGGLSISGIGALVEGMDIDDVIARVEGIHCGMKATSCPDQLAQALKAVK